MILLFDNLKLKSLGGKEGSWFGTLNKILKKEQVQTNAQPSNIHYSAT